MLNAAAVRNTIGLIGGGQLGRMLILAGKPLGFCFSVLDDEPDAPAAGIADHFIRGSLYDEDALSTLTSLSDITTFEIEHANTDALLRLAEDGAVVRPSARELALINDKYEQKRALLAAGIPVPAFHEKFSGSYPVVQKVRHGGYDGRGVAVLTGPGDPVLEGESYYEDLVALKGELSVLVARRPGGETAVYPVVDMEFHGDANLVSRVVMPSSAPSEVQDAAREVAVRAVETLRGVGVHAVEIFWATSGEVLVNEVAPRPHNSGHITIEACQTSQFEQHLRAICDLPLGSTELLKPAVTLNLVGAPGASGTPSTRAIARMLAFPGVHPHWYGKAAVRPFRKMGHVTVLADSLGQAETTAESLRDLIWIEGDQQ